MTVTVETLDGLTRRVNLSLDKARVASEVNKRLARIARTARLDGFRPGKAPLRMIAARYGQEIQGEVLGEALQHAFTDAMSANKLAVAGYPRFEPGTDDSFVATFEVFPEIVLGDVTQIRVTRPVVEITAADVDRTLEVLRKQRIQYHTVARAAQQGDRLHLDYLGKIGGAPFQGGDARDFPVILGEGRTLPAFEQALAGLKAGEQKTFDVTFPADYFAPELAGKTATFEVEVKSVQQPELPEVDDAFAASMGVHEGGVARLREEVAGNLEREARRRILAKVKEQVLNGLLQTTPFEVPASLVELERQALYEKAVQELKARGMKDAEIRLGAEVFDAQARRRVALGLLLEHIISGQGIVAADAQVRALVGEFAQSYEDPGEVVAWYYQDAARLKEARALVLEENVVNWVLERAQVTDEVTGLEQIMGSAT